MHLLQGYAKIKEWLGEVARLSDFGLLPVESISQLVSFFVSAWLFLSPILTLIETILQYLVLDVLKCIVCISQQAWPTGTQQILIPSSWQQVPGVAIHSSAHQSNVAESPLETVDGATQQQHNWRSDLVPKPFLNLLTNFKGVYCAL